MSERPTVAADAEVTDLALRMEARQARLVALLGAIGEARLAHKRARWALVERLDALEKERPGARWLAGDKVYWMEGPRLCSEPADTR